ncbi:MAG: hypothetical protein HYY09_06900 [Firmicutes bacterium]|nr:hypothetical protein [Bacillota bacterium]
MGILFNLFLLLVLVDLVVSLILLIPKRTRPLSRTLFHVLAGLLVLAGISLRVGGGPMGSALQVIFLGAVVESLVSFLSAVTSKKGNSKLWLIALIVTVIVFVWSILR